MLISNCWNICLWKNTECIVFENGQFLALTCEPSPLKQLEFQNVLVKNSLKLMKANFTIIVHCYSSRQDLFKLWH